MSLAVVLLLGLLASGFGADRPAGAAADPANIHTIFLCECGPYFEWMTLAMMWSHKKSGQPGPITRVLCCTEEQAKQIPPEHLALAPTHIAPSFTVNPHNGDIYQAYNKPLAVIDFLERAEPPEEWLLVIDADMLIREPFMPQEMGATLGRPVAAYFGYLKGVANELALKHVPEVQPRTDSEGGQPVGRRGDQVGGFEVMHKEDMKKLMHNWLKYTEDVRFDPDAWNLTGDVACTKPTGCRVWIAEMYGYSYAAAKADVWHKIDHHSMLYPGMQPGSANLPRLMHYGLHFQVGDYTFDKHWHFGFDALQCPPWDMTTDRPKGGLFPHPPLPSSLSKERDAKTVIGDLLSIETVNTMNEAMCDYHLRSCSRTDQLVEECLKVKAIADEVADGYDALGKLGPGQPGALCVDANENCQMWAQRGECSKTEAYMTYYCCVSCGIWRGFKGHRIPQDSALYALNRTAVAPRPHTDKQEPAAITADTATTAAAVIAAAAQPSDVAAAAPTTADAAAQPTTSSAAAEAAVAAAPTTAGAVLQDTSASDAGTAEDAAIAAAPTGTTESAKAKDKTESVQKIDTAAIKHKIKQAAAGDGDNAAATMVEGIQPPQKAAADDDTAEDGTADVHDDAGADKAAVLQPAQVGEAERGADVTVQQQQQQQAASNDDEQRANSKSRAKRHRNRRRDIESDEDAPPRRTASRKIPKLVGKGGAASIRVVVPNRTRDLAHDVVPPLLFMMFGAGAMLMSSTAWQQIRLRCRRKVATN